jgi:DNA primase
MGIVADDIERVRSSVSIVDVVSQYVTLRRVGRNLSGLCPFHSEKTPSFSVREDTGRYKCFGCNAGGDVFTFVQEIEHLDFVGTVEKLASRAGIELHYTSGPDDKTRQRRKDLLSLMEKAVDWYHERLLTDPDARPAREYLKARGITGEVARTFKLGWAPDDWDQLAKHLCSGPNVSGEVLHEVGLGFVNKRDRLQDSFRARIMFPIFDEGGHAVAFGARVLPGSTDPAKYKNSTETPIYTKSRTLYGLNWAKSDIVKTDTVVICEGYTDVIGFHRIGMTNAVATCGTALTEEHVKLLKRFATNVVLAFDADAAGQGAAARFYEWEKRYAVSVSVAKFPEGRDPGDLASSDPDALRAAIQNATPFLGFRLQRVLDAGDTRSPEGRARTAEQAMRVINEHPDINVRSLYAGQVASHTGIAASELVKIATTGRIDDVVVSTARHLPDGAGFIALSLLIHRWDDIAPWLTEELFIDEPSRRAFLSLVEAEGDVTRALALTEGESADLIERAAVVEYDADPFAEARTLIAAAVRRELAKRSRSVEPEDIRHDRTARLRLDDLQKPPEAEAAAAELLGWLATRTVVDG